MRVGDILYFAPGLRFAEVDIDGPRLPEQFRLRIVGFYLQPARDCITGEHAFAAGVLLVSCIDALARLSVGGRMSSRFKGFVTQNLQGFAGAGLAGRFFDEFRNGLIHEARLKKGAQFSLETDVTVLQLQGLLLVNPKYLATDVEYALNSFVALTATTETERLKLATALKLDLAEDFAASGA